jgi:hypothetical protein
MAVSADQRRHSTADPRHGQFGGRRQFPSLRLEIAKTLVSNVSSAVSFGYETPRADLVAGGIELVDVDHAAVPDPVAGAGSTDIEMLLGIVLPGLLGREPSAEKGVGSLPTSARLY